MLWLIWNWGASSNIGPLFFDRSPICSQQMLNTKINLNITWKIDWGQIARRLPRLPKENSEISNWVMDDPSDTLKNSIHPQKKLVCNLLTLNIHSWRCYKYQSLLKSVHLKRFSIHPWKWFIEQIRTLQQLRRHNFPFFRNLDSYNV